MYYCDTDYSFCKQYMGDDEYILWKGKPEDGNLVTRQDIFMIPFSIMWCGFAIFWETTAILDGGPIFFCLWGIPFVLVGLYMVFGRFIHIKFLRKRTFYVITNKKIIRSRNNRIDILDGKMIPPIYIEVFRNGNGTIHFEVQTYGNVRGNRRNMGMVDDRFKIENIADVIRVQQAINLIEK